MGVPKDYPKHVYFHQFSRHVALLGKFFFGSDKVNAYENALNVFKDWSKGVRFFLIVVKNERNFARRDAHPCPKTNKMKKKTTLHIFCVELRAVLKDKNVKRRVFNSSYKGQSLAQTFKYNFNYVKKITSVRFKKNGYRDMLYLNLQRSKSIIVWIRSRKDVIITTTAY